MVLLSVKPLFGLIKHTHSLACKTYDNHQTATHSVARSNTQKVFKKTLSLAYFKK